MRHSVTLSLMDTLHEVLEDKDGFPYFGDDEYEAKEMLLDSFKRMQKKLDHCINIMSKTKSIEKLSVENVMGNNDNAGDTSQTMSSLNDSKLNNTNNSMASFPRSPTSMCKPTNSPVPPVLPSNHHKRSNLIEAGSNLLKRAGSSLRLKTKVLPSGSSSKTQSNRISEGIGSSPVAAGRLTRFRKCKDEIAKAAEEAFNLIDANGDGFLQKEEVLEAVMEMKRNHVIESGIDAMEMTESMIKEVDKDGDGQIDIDEFVEMMRRSSDSKDAAGNRMTFLAKNILLAHQKKLEKNIVGDDLWMINPTDWRHASWDILVSILIMVTVVTMPLTIAWEEMNDRFFVMNVTFDFMFLIDVVKNFCTGFIDENDAIIMDNSIVCSNYLKGFFLTDVVSSIPLDLILMAAGVKASESVSGTKQTLKMLKLLRLAKLFRLLRLSRFFRYIKMVFMYFEEYFHIRISDGFIKLSRLAVGALFLAHWIGCFNFMLVRMNDFPSDSWVVYAGLEDQAPYSQWSWSFFKALAQMIMIGFETPPFTNASCDTASDWCSIEHWTTLLCLYLGAVFYSLLISSISSIIQTASLASRNFEEKLIELDDYMRSKKLPATLREKVKDYFHLQHTDGKLFNERGILDMVTPMLRREIQEFNGRGVAEKVPLLSSVNHKIFANELAGVIQSTIAFTDEILIKEGTVGNEMYFVNSGVLDIYVGGNQSDAYCTIGDGCFFGEVSILLGIRRTASIRTRTQCVLYKVSKEDLLAILQEFPETQAKIYEVAQSRMRRLKRCTDPSSNAVYGLDDEVDSEDRRTELFGLDAEQVVCTKEESFEKNRRNARIKKRPTHYKSGQKPQKDSFLMRKNIRNRPNTEELSIV